MVVATSSTCISIAVVTAVSPRRVGYHHERPCRVCIMAIAFSAVSSAVSSAYITTAPLSSRLTIATPPAHFMHSLSPCNHAPCVQ
jgi:hypothetical protein